MNHPFDCPCVMCDPMQVRLDQQVKAMSETPQETAQAWCEKHAEHKSVPGTKFVSGRLLCSRDDVVQLLQPLVAERDALRAEVGERRAENARLTSFPRSGHEAQAKLEKAEAALGKLRWLGENWPGYWIVGPLWTNAKRYEAAIEAVKALRDTAPRRSSHDA